ncbi:hypothetical protein SEPCBS119000_003624 [Sporothrix epigloea]|uniref:Uncharacterized protein n=1 Tax=Sporothrix epigloea TaxID=1892477 RepID=A0ABP0DNW3_9PEZI
MGIFSFKRGHKTKQSKVDNSDVEVERDIFNQVFLSDDLYMQGHDAASITKPVSHLYPNSTPPLRKDKLFISSTNQTKRSNGGALQIPSRPWTSGSGAAAPLYRQRIASDTNIPGRNPLVQKATRLTDDRPGSSNSRPSTSHGVTSVPWVNTHTSFNAAFSPADRQLYRPKEGTTSSRPTTPIVARSRPTSNSPTGLTMHKGAHSLSDKYNSTSSSAATEASDLSSAVLAEEQQERATTPPSVASSFAPRLSLSVSPESDRHYSEKRESADCGRLVESKQSPDLGDTAQLPLDDAAVQTVRTPDQQQQVVEVHQAPSVQESPDVRSRDASEAREDSITPTDHSTSARDVVKQRDPASRKLRRRSWAAQIDQLEKSWLEEQMGSYGRDVTPQPTGSTQPQTQQQVILPADLSKSNGADKHDNELHANMSAGNDRHIKYDKLSSQSTYTPGVHSLSLDPDGSPHVPDDYAGRDARGVSPQQLHQTRNDQPQLRTAKPTQQCLPHRRDYSPLGEYTSASPDSGAHGNTAMPASLSLQSAQNWPSPSSSSSLLIKADGGVRSPPHTTTLPVGELAGSRMRTSQEICGHPAYDQLTAPADSPLQMADHGNLCGKTYPALYRPLYSASNDNIQSFGVPDSGRRHPDPVPVRYPSATLLESPALERGQRLTSLASKDGLEKEKVTTDARMDTRDSMDDKTTSPANSQKMEPNTAPVRAFTQPPPVLDLPQSVSSGSLDKVTLNSFPMPTSCSVSLLLPPMAPLSKSHWQSSPPQMTLTNESDPNYTGPYCGINPPSPADDFALDTLTGENCIKTTAEEEDDSVADASSVHTSLMAINEVEHVERLLINHPQTPAMNGQNVFSTTFAGPFGSLGGTGVDLNNDENENEIKSPTGSTGELAEPTHRDLRSSVAPWSPITLPAGDAEPSPTANWPLPVSSLSPALEIKRTPRQSELGNNIPTILVDDNKDDILIGSRNSPKRSRSPFTASVYAQDIGLGPYAYDDTDQSDNIETLTADALLKSRSASTLRQLPTPSDATRVSAHLAATWGTEVFESTPEQTTRAPQEPRIPATFDDMVVDTRPESNYSYCGNVSATDSENTSYVDVGDGNSNVFYDLDSSSQTSREYNDSPLSPESIGRARGPSILAESPAFWEHASESMLAFQSPRGEKRWNIAHHRVDSETLHEQITKDGSLVSTREGQVDKFGTALI